MNEIEKAKETLSNAGYYAGHLWHVNDVNDDTLTDEEKLELIRNAIARDCVYERINENIQDELLMRKECNYERETN